MKESAKPGSIFEGVDLGNIQKVIDQLDEFRKQIASGLLDDIFKVDSEESYSTLKAFLHDEFDPNVLKEKVELAVEKMARGNTTLKDAFGIDPEGMESFYYIGYSMFQKRNYPAARRAFELILQLDPFESRYYHALAATQHKQKDFFAAAQNYTMAFTTSAINNPELHYHSADCYLKMDDLVSAIVSLGCCIEACDDRNDIHRQIKMRSTTLREVLIKNLAERESKKRTLRREQQVARSKALEAEREFNKTKSNARA